MNILISIRQQGDITKVQLQQTWHTHDAKPEQAMQNENFNTFLFYFSGL